MRIALAIALAGCHVSTNGSVVVRMAKPGEVFANDPMFEKFVRTTCRGSGDRARRYYLPVVAFAREQLLQEDEAKQARATLTFAKEVPIHQGFEIVVEPLSEVGRLRVSQKRGEWDAGTNYCLFVLPTRYETTIVVKRVMTWIK